MKLAEVRKFLVALVGALASLLSLGLLPDPVGKYVAGALAVLSAFGVYRVPNAKATP
jgi:hypothetical protein